MKNALHIVLIFCGVCFTSSLGFAQEWKDSLNRARALYKAGNYKEALKYYKSSERLAPNDVDLSEEMGQTAYKAGDFKTAETCFEEVAAKAETKEKRLRANTNLGETRMQQRNYEGAIEAFKNVLRENPSNEKARQRLMEAQRMKRQQDSKKNQTNKEQQQEQQKEQQQNKENKQNCDKPNQNQQNQNSSQKQANKPNTGDQKLQDKQTERKLDELSRQELGTKKRLDGSKGTKGGKRAGKDW
jgi:tetratricopeptide (TPR) repeat protein